MFAFCPAPPIRPPHPTPPPPKMILADAMKGYIQLRFVLFQRASHINVFYVYFCVGFKFLWLRWNDSNVYNHQKSEYWESVIKSVCP